MDPIEIKTPSETRNYSPSFALEGNHAKKETNNVDI